MLNRKHLPAVAIGVVAAAIGILVWLQRGSEDRASDTDTRATRNVDVPQSDTEDSSAMNVATAGSRPNPSGKKRPWPPRLEQLRKDFLKAAEEGDLRAVRELGQQMDAESSGYLNGAVNSLITRTLKELMRGRKEERHAPPAMLSDSEARSLVSRFNLEQDPNERLRILGELSRTRLPNELLPEIVGIIERSLTNTPGDIALLSILNSFVGKESEGALFKFTKPPFSSSVRVSAISQLARRELSSSQLEAFSSAAKAEGDDGVRAEWTKLIAKKYDPNLESKVLSSLSDSSAQVRASAVIGLNPSVDSHRETLIGVLKDPSAIVRSRAITQLSMNIENEKVFEAIVARAKQDNAEDVRLRAIGSLNRARFSKDANALATLEGISTGDPSEKVRLQAKKILFWLKRNQ